MTITVDGRDQYQMDGDTVGECSTMIAEIRPGALRLRIPRDSALARPPQNDRASRGGPGAHQRGARPAGRPGV